MHLTRALLFYVRRRKIPGHLEIGKHQLVKPVTLAMKKKAVEDLLLQEQNMKLLSRPYLTPEEEHGHVSASGRKEEKFARLNDERIMSRMFKNHTMEEHFEHLNVTKRWE